MVRRLFAPQLPERGGRVELPAESVEHARVLRLARDDRVELVDTRLGTCAAVVVEASARRVVCEAEPCRRVEAPAPALHVVLALPKGSKLEDMTRMLAELGVSGLHLAHAERSVPRFDKPEARRGRLERIVREACLQSGQPQALAVHPPVPLLDAARRAPHHATRLLFWEEGGEALPWLDAEQKRHEAWIVIGPEGGLSRAEAAALTALGYITIGLGPAVLRVQTAAPVIAALVLDRLGRLRG
jgi:16S rRNA (uracil1498-N3)-methyltransferase